MPAAIPRSAKRKTAALPLGNTTASLEEPLVASYRHTGRVLHRATGDRLSWLNLTPPHGHGQPIRTGSLGPDVPDLEGPNNPDHQRVRGRLHTPPPSTTSKNPVDLNGHHSHPSGVQPDGSEDTTPRSTSTQGTNLPHQCNGELIYNISYIKIESVI